jgi:hypothetical protein
VLIVEGDGADRSRFVVATSGRTGGKLVYFMSIDGGSVGGLSGR